MTIMMMTISDSFSGVLQLLVLRGSYFLISYPVSTEMISGCADTSTGTRLLVYSKSSPPLQLFFSSIQMCSAFSPVFVLLGFVR